MVPLGGVILALQLDAATPTSAQSKLSGPHFSALLGASHKKVAIRIISVLVVVLMALLALDGVVVAKRMRYQREIVQLRTSMSAVELQRIDQIVAQEKNKVRLAIELARGEAQRTLHLAISIDSATMYLEREGALLRAMLVQIGPERRVGIPPDTVRLAKARGLRTIAQTISGDHAWEVPPWVYADRGLPPTPGMVRGALGPIAVILVGGTVIYSMPASGPLSDSSYILPGAIRARAEDLRAILPSLSAGMRVYLY
jgi:hypothetical protein